MAQDQYEVTLSDGRIVTVTADHEPTLEEVMAALPAEGTYDDAVLRGTITPDNPDPYRGPDTYAEGYKQGMQEGNVGSAKGIAKGILPGMWQGAKDTFAAVTSLPGQVAALASDPFGAAEGVAADFTKMPERFRGLRFLPNFFEDQARLARTDPEGFGRQVGEQVGAVAGGAATGAVLPFGPKPLMRKVGRTLRVTGQKGEWPIRMMGAHQLGSGNLLGLGTITAPEALVSAGTKIERMGTKAGAALETFAGKAAQLESDVAKLAKSPDPQLAASIQSRVDAIRAAHETALKGAKLDSEIATITKEQNRLREIEGRLRKLSRTQPTPRTPDPAKVELQRERAHETANQMRAAEERAAAKAQQSLLDADKKAAAAATEASRKAEANLRRLEEIERRKKGLEAKPATVSETISAETPEGGRASATTRYATPPEEAIDAAAGGDPVIAELLKRGVSPEAAARATVGPPRGASSAAPIKLGEGVADEFRSPAVQQLDESIIERRMADRDATGPIVPDNETAQVVEAARVAASGDDPITSAMAARLRRRSTQDIPPSQSRRTPMSNTPGLTEEDIRAIGGNPRLNYKNIPEVRAVELELQRAMRARNYREQARLEKRLRQLLGDE